MSMPTLQNKETLWNKVIPNETQQAGKCAWLLYQMMPRKTVMIPSFSHYFITFKF